MIIESVLEILDEISREIQGLECYEPRCKVCNSPLRYQIEDMRLKGGLSLRKIRGLLLQIGKEILIMSLSKHFRKHI